MFEPQPRFVEGDGSTKAVAKRHGCVLFPTVVWITEQDFEFQMVENHEASSLFSGSVWDQNVTKLNVRSIDVVKFFIENISPNDYNYMRLDVEGAEYDILRVLISSGLGCWLGTVELEFHATHHKNNYNKRPLDVAYPWMLRQCGVKVSVGNFYPEKFFLKGDQYCRHCDMLNDGGIDSKKHD